MTTQKMLSYLRKGITEYGLIDDGDKIAVGIDIKNGLVAIKGWTETSDLDAFDFCEKMEKIGVKTVICTDISKDGAMQGTNHQLYRDLSNKFSLNIIASGGVSSIEDIDLGLKPNIQYFNEESAR